ncbi:MAG: hypothetical protein L6Q77_05505 [Bacteroidetes bacterium]|nr:hypothetical protein [Bacteroidota bacterium]
MSKENKPLQFKRTTRSVLFSVLTVVFISYIFFFPDWWLASLIMAGLSAFALFINLRLK